MTTEEIYKLANEMTEKEAMNVVKGWQDAKELKPLKTFESLVLLGDSKQLAVATIIAQKINEPWIFETNENSIYSIVYES